MDSQVLPLELTTAHEKAVKKNDRAVRAGGWGASDVAMELAQRHIGHLAGAIKTRIAETHPNATAAAFLKVAGQLEPEVLALIGLSTCLHACATEQTSTELFMACGHNVAAECWAEGLTKHNPELAQRIERMARAKRGSIGGRRRAATVAASRAGYAAKEWPNDLVAHAGSWLVDATVEGLPDLFYWYSPENDVKKLTIHQHALDAAEDAVCEIIMSRPVHLPRLTPPQPWTGWKMTNDDPRVSFGTTFMRTRYKDVEAAARAAIKDGAMAPALAGVNALQATPWRINKRLMGVISGCLSRSIAVPGLPDYVDRPLPALEKPWDEATPKERAYWRRKYDRTKNRNVSQRADRLMVVQDMKTAEWLAEADRFWTPMNLDWRGRVYSLCHFAFARDDRVRALFLFGQGEPIGEEGIYWLKVHVANCGAFDKIDKAPMADRVKWVDDNMEAIRECTENPCRHGSWWMTADSPFLFLAACMELVSALNEGPNYVTHLPVSFDGSCSGLQHLAAMTRDAQTAAMVNLCLTDRPQDIYNAIADNTKSLVEADLTKEFKTKEGEIDPVPHALAHAFLDYGISRKVAKRNVMTYSYSSKKYGMASQQQTDLMNELDDDVLTGELEEHPFAPWHEGKRDKEGEEHPGKAARYIASHVFDAIEERIHLPAEAMKMLQSIAKALAHEGKPVRWTTPVGIPWVNRYHQHRLARLRLWMHDRGVKTEMRVMVAVGDEKEIDKGRAANGVAPNFVHALDGSHLLLSVNASVAEGITSIATVHDSFGCLASRAGRFNAIIRAELVRMYETHDVLSEILERAKCDLTEHNWPRLPELPVYGQFNLKEISNAPYAFA